VLEQFASIEVSIADYESLALGSKNESVRLGALNKRAEQQRQHFELRREYGIVPAPDDSHSILGGQRSHPGGRRFESG
jgi:hypothetical protein